MRTTSFIHKKMFLLPQAKASAADTLLSRHGYGPDNFCIDAQPKAGGEVTHKACAVVADSAMLTILRNVCNSVDATYKEKPRPVDPSLDEEDLKRPSPNSK